MLTRDVLNSYQGLILVGIIVEVTTFTQWFLRCSASWGQVNRWMAEYKVHV